MKKILLPLLLFVGYSAYSQTSAVTVPSQKENTPKVKKQEAPKREVKVAKLDATKQDPEVRPKSDRTN